MSRRDLAISPLTIQRQAEASDPGRSAWVSANAGSGKTTVLVRRVLRLLLSGVEPARILCLTFTEAAAANMKNRLFAALRGWAGLDDGALRQEIATIGQDLRGSASLARARTLFAAALETPGGLKIHTIHGFCTRVLQSAPFEANVPARFDIVQGAEAQALMDEAVRRALGSAAADGESALGRAIARVATDVEETRFAEAIAAILADRDLLRDDEGALLPEDRLRARLDNALGLDAEASAEAVIAGFLAAHAAPERLRWLKEALAGSPNKTDRDKGTLLAGTGPEADPNDAFEVFQRVLLKKDGGRPVRIVTDKFAGLRPDVAEALDRLCDACLEARDSIARIAARDRSAALMALARAILARYEALKARRRRLDFEDLIARTRALLGRIEAAWVLYKLDAGIDHLLIDEAQDTSQAQWTILTRLTAEFFAGAGAHEAIRPGPLNRTVFAVGDEKQSIYSFQKADPASFEAMRRHFEGRIAAVSDVGHRFSRVPLIQSFRSTTEVMAAVDAIFAPPAHHKGLVFAEGERPPPHETARRDGPGAVDLWPLEANDTIEERLAWEEPVDAPSSAVLKLARRIARVLKRWTDQKHDDLGRAFQPGDVLILLRKRSALFQAIVRELKQAGVPVAGVDRLKVGSHIAVEDLMALGRAALLPEDDLTLAVALKTPILGLDDTHLLAIAPERKGSLRTELRERAKEDATIALAEARFAEFEARARRLGPFGFYAQLLGPEGGRKAMLGRLGAEAGDALDAFLAAALDFERRKGPSLLAFLGEMEAASQELKRDLAEASAEVRVMTVHGAKGLEAPVVLIPEIGESGGNAGRRQLFELAAQDRSVSVAVPVWVPRAELHCSVSLAAKQALDAAQDEERRRLFYVALTRAEDRLILCGANPKGVAGPESWYGMAEAGLADFLVEAPGPEGAGMIRRFSRSAAVPPENSPATIPEPLLPPLPGWARTPAPAAADAPHSIAPSRAAPPAARLASTEGAGANRRAFGALVHRLLQHLPEIDAAARPAAAQALVRLHGRALNDEERTRAIALSLALLERPELQALFGPLSLAEVPISGIVDLPGGPRAVTGRIDRLALAGDVVWIADYKTGDRPPAEAEGIAPEAVIQLALYHDLVGRLYRDRTIRSVVIYPANGAIFEISAKQRALALAAIAGGGGPGLL